MSIHKVEVCFSPVLFPDYENKEANVVIVDVLRATSAIITAFQNGVEKLIPVKTIKEARKLKQKGYMVAAERDGIVLDFADFGNSPFNFTKEKIGNRTIAYSTTNGTMAIHMASKCNKVIIGGFLNISALEEWLISEQRDVIILCAAWKNKFNLEDSVFAGALAERLLKQSSFNTICDSVHGAIDLWKIARTDLVGYIEKAAQRSRLKKNGLDDVIPYCFTEDVTSVIPVLEGEYLVELKNSGN